MVGVRAYVNRSIRRSHAQQSCFSKFNAHGKTISARRSSGPAGVLRVGLRLLLAASDGRFAKKTLKRGIVSLKPQRTEAL